MNDFSTCDSTMIASYDREKWAAITAYMPFAHDNPTDHIARPEVSDNFCRRSFRCPR